MDRMSITAPSHHIPACSIGTLPKGVEKERLRMADVILREEGFGPDGLPFTVDGAMQFAFERTIRPVRSSQGSRFLPR